LVPPLGRDARAWCRAWRGINGCLDSLLSLRAKRSCKLGLKGHFALGERDRCESKAGAHAATCALCS
jgi:hypothetical protein